MLAHSGYLLTLTMNNVSFLVMDRNCSCLRTQQTSRHILSA